ncbi:helix-turn-helix domain-containing protein [Gymnodinialimonas hymeniacidonis]|uniref:AraC family transcriptional regulator n=1 Tax=Gymnodinialimonas hymeniacidonis TaxID=3126508 RepID=UPI0034C5D257
MEILDLALRIASIALMGLLALLLVRQTRIGWEGRISFIAVAATETAFLLNTTLMPLGFPPALSANLTLLASLSPNAITWLIVTIFLDPPLRRWPWLVASSIVSALFYLHQIMPDAPLAYLCAFSGMALYGALFVLALWSSRDDLVDCRCRARPGFAAAIAGLGLILTGGQAFGMLEEGTAVMALLKSTGIFAVTFAFALWILSPDVTLWPSSQNTPPSPAPKPAPQDPDAALINRLDAAMADGIWREEGLTIGALAARLAVPEHRLRRAINGGLGHRNFSSFINRQRIEAAKAQLADPDLCGKTVLEIAYDVGFASLGPFNRAFRADTGQSPTEYRRTACEDLSPDLADSENITPIRANLH